MSVYDISCIDAPWRHGQREPFAAAIYSGASAKTLIQTILAGHFTLEYDSSLDDAKVTGYIPDCTKREALQQIAFAICATIDTSGTRGIKGAQARGGRRRRRSRLTGLYTGGSVETSSPVTEVRVTAHAYKTTGSGDSVEVDGTTYYHTTTVTTKTNPKVTATTSQTSLRSGTPRWSTAATSPRSPSTSTTITCAVRPTACGSSWTARPPAITSKRRRRGAARSPAQSPAWVSCSAASPRLIAK